MSQITRSVCELLPNEACDLYASSPEPMGSAPQREESHRGPHSRTSLKQYILDPVLPMLTLLSMSVLTVVMLVTIVAAVADMDLRLPDAYVDIDPWTGMPPSLAEPSYRDQGPYAGLTSPVAPRDDSESRPDAPLADPF